MPKTRLAIVIVNYRTARLTVDCLRSLAAERARMLAVEGAGGEVGGDWRVVVADNASGDDSVEVIGRAIVEGGWGGWCELRALPRNGGFAYGNNAAIEPLLRDPTPPTHFWLLNPDTVVCPGSVGAVMAAISGEGGGEILGTEVVNPDGSRRRSAFRFPTPLGELDAAAGMGLISRVLTHWAIAPEVGPGEVVDWVSGASMVIPAGVFREVGLLDESYFMYYEETDLCIRARRAGWRCRYLGTAPVVHIVGQSSGVTAAATRAARRRPAYWFRSRVRFFRKNHGVAYAVMADLAWFTGLVVGRVYAALRRKPWSHPPRLITDAIRNGYFGHRPA